MIVINKILALYYIISFLIKTPYFFKNPFKNKIVVRIWWKVNFLYEIYLKKANKIIDINISDDYIWVQNIVTIKADAHDLNMIESNSVDYVISSHTIEHLTNPIKAIKEWWRILKKWWIMYHSIPYYKKTFDNKRLITSIQHLIEDYKNNVNLSDITHNKEFVANYDIKKDSSFITKDEWYKNYLINPIIYTHFHVFNKTLVEELFNYCWIKKNRIFFNNISIEYFWIKE